jgi:hypothetical protein
MNADRAAQAPQARTQDRTLIVGSVVGLVIAFTIALVISLVPSWVLTETGSRIVVYVLLAVTAPAFVLPLWALAPRAAMDPRRLTWAAIGGALLFDGAALGFLPGLYGQTGDAWAYTAAGLLWAFGWLVVTELLVEHRRGTP